MLRAVAVEVVLGRSLWKDSLWVLPEVRQDHLTNRAQPRRLELKDIVDQKS